MIKEKLIQIDDYDYPLPEDKIAFFPVSQRDHSKLLVYKNGVIQDKYFYQLPEILDDNTVLIFNDSKVIHARLLAHNLTGAAIEIFCLEPLFPTNELSTAFIQTGCVKWKCLVGNAKKWKQPLSFEVVIDNTIHTITAEKGDNMEGAFEVTFTWSDSSITFADWIEAYGKMPLPPYIKRTAEKEDEYRYQTIYAEHNGSVAAPTAGLHFSEEVMQQLKAKEIITEYVTLHVGAGTFKPVSASTLGDHFMHREQIIIKADFISHLLKLQDKKMVAVGTTVARTVESLFVIGAKLYLHLATPLHVEQWEVYENKAISQVTLTQSLEALLAYMHENNTDLLHADTQLLILPTYQHKVTQGIITNFHQPKSTLLLLIASYLGNNWKTIYEHALEQNYRFLSFGDSNYYELNV